MGKASCCDKNGLKKGPWTAEEDQKLIEFIQKHGNRKWRTVSKEAGLRRCGKSCRLRWTNYLKPGIKRGKFSLEEEETIIQLHSVLGNKWSTIATRLPGRTDNEIKNFWNTHIKKRLLRMGIDPVTHAPRMDLLEIASMLSSSLYNPTQQQNYNSLGFGPPVVNQNLLNLLTSFIISSSPEHKNTPQDLHQESNQILNIQDSLMMRSLWQNNNGELYDNVGDEYCFVSKSNVACENGNIQCLMMNPEAQNQTGVVSSNNDQFLLSSTPTLSSSMYVNSGTTEDEKDSYSCSSMLMFDHIPNSSGFGSFQ